MRIKEEVEQLLPLIRNGQVSGEGIRDISERIRQVIREEPSKGKELGELIGLIKKASKPQPPAAMVNWVPVSGGFLAIGHKPGGKLAFGDLKLRGTTAVLTLLHENEGAAFIGQRLSHLDIEWIWFPFSASSPHDGEAREEVRALFRNLEGLLSAGGRIYIHCSAGIHRTGMIAYGLLRFLGKDRSEAGGLLRALRKVTAEQVGDERLSWGDLFGTR